MPQRRVLTGAPILADSMAILFLRDPAYLGGDVIRVEVGSALRLDRVTPWPNDRQRRGYGWTPSGSSGYGFGLSLTYGRGVYGGGFYGQGVEVNQHHTNQDFVAGDYTVRLKAIDSLGNESPWSDPFTVAHRPNPPAPRLPALNTEIQNNTLIWTWSDP